MDKLIYIMGKSATGKDTIYKMLKKKADLKGVVIYTTRPKRDNEKKGVEYFFVDEDFLESNKDKIIEKRIYNTKFGPWIYATLDDGQFDKKGILVVIGTLESYTSCKSYFGDDKIIPIYIEVDDKIREERSIARLKNIDEISLKEIHRRIEADNNDFSDIKLKKAGITKKYYNYELNKCFNDIMADLRREIERI